MILTLITRLLGGYASRPVAARPVIDRDKIIAAVLPAAALYGVDIATVDPAWFWERDED
ncbi:hypothetical protein [Shimwellia pseudoproteus]|uniref:hypothetical protein n=1 Tax=Shimwellia pseudoproteus TaxID=570012 RepID=UPI0018EA6E49|nr:hypothetical protein [Shimwellia pseudoproteus]